jgi:hypothetical protein
MLDLNLMLPANLNACTIDYTYWERAGSDSSLGEKKDAKIKLQIN